MLKTLGSILMDYTDLTVQFQWLGTILTCESIQNNDIKEITSSQLKRLHARKSISAFYHLALTTIDTNNCFISSCPYIVQLILRQFSLLFRNLRTYHQHVLIPIISFWSLMRVQLTCVHIGFLIIETENLKVNSWDVHTGIFRHSTSTFSSTLSHVI